MLKPWCGMCRPVRPPEPDTPSAALPRQNGVPWPQHRTTPSGPRTVAFTAPCPACGQDAAWVQAARQDGTSEVTRTTRIDCPCHAGQAAA